MSKSGRTPGRSQERRQITVTLDGLYEGWEATCYADFSMRILADLNSGNEDRVMAGLDAILIDHNFPDAEQPDRIAATIAAVDFRGLTVFVEKLALDLQAIPNR